VRYYDPTGRRRSKTFAKKIDAKQYANIVEADKTRGHWHDPDAGKVSVGEWAKEVEHGTPDVQPSTQARDDSYIRTMILPYFEDSHLDKIRPLDVQRWIGDLQRRPYAPATIRKAYQLLSRLFDSAVANRMLLKSPCANIRLPRPVHQEMPYLTAEGLMAVAEAIDQRYRALVIVAGTTGLRFGELAALTPADVDLDRKTITVTKSLSEVKGVVQVTRPKSKASVRTVTLPAFVVAELTWHMSRHADSSRYVFPAPDGGALRRSNFRRRFWLPAVRKSAQGDLRFHDLRHTAVALLIAQGIHAKTIQARMGHASIRTTLDRYGHLFDTLDVAAADALDDLFNTGNTAQEGTKWGPDQTGIAAETP
jgi:integrase